MASQQTVVQQGKISFLFIVSALGTSVTTLGAPTELVTSELTARGFRVSWTHAPGKVEKYRVVYYPTRGGQPEEVMEGKHVIWIQAK